MNENIILKIIGIYLILDGIISAIVLGSFGGVYGIENIFRYVRALIGVYLVVNG